METALSRRGQMRETAKFGGNLETSPPCRPQPSQRQKHPTRGGRKAVVTTGMEAGWMPSFAVMAREPRIGQVERTIREMFVRFCFPRARGCRSRSAPGQRRRAKTSRPTGANGAPEGGEPVSRHKPIKSSTCHSRWVSKSERNVSAYGFVSCHSSAALVVR